MQMILSSLLTHWKNVSLKEAMEKKGLRVNAEKTTVKICGSGLDLHLFQVNIHALSVVQE